MQTSWQVDKFTILPNDLEDVSLYVKYDHGEPVHHLPFLAVLSWLCKGPIPPDIVKLTNLQRLVLYQNQLTGRYIHKFTQWSRRCISTSNIWWTSSPSPFFLCFVLTLYRADSARNRQIDKFDYALAEQQPADRSINLRFHPMIFKTYLYVKKDHGEPVHHLPFFAFLSWLCIGPIPPDVVKLTNLQELFLEANQLTGQQI